MQNPLKWEDGGGVGAVAGGGTSICCLCQYEIICCWLVGFLSLFVLGGVCLICFWGFFCCCCFGVGWFCFVLFYFSTPPTGLTGAGNCV